MTTTRAAMALLLFCGLSAVSHAQDYVASFAAATSVSVPAATHGKGTTDKVAVRDCYSTEFRYVLRRGTDYTWSAASNGNISIALTTATTGECRIAGTVSTLEQAWMPGLPLLFADAALQSALFDLPLSGDWDGGSITLRASWTTEDATTNEIRVGARARCGTSAASVVAGWSEAVTYVTTTSAASSKGRQSDFVLTPSACAPGQRMWVQILRDGGHAEDTATVAWQLLSAYAYTTRSIRILTN